MIVFQATSPLVRPLGLMAALLLLLIIASPVIATEEPPLRSQPLTLPPGFREVTVVDGLLAPRDFVHTPDGRMLILEAGSDTSDDPGFASIRVFKSGALLPRRAWSNAICGDGERGLMGIVLDADFTTNGYLYIFYSALVMPAPNWDDRLCRNRVSRLTLRGDLIDPATEVVLLDNIASPNTAQHSGGDLTFGLDGDLYMSTGDGKIPLLSASTSLLNGKVLRLRLNATRDGYTTPANPFDTVPNARYCGLTPLPEGDGPCREIWAYGLRHPYRITIQPAMPGIPGTNLVWVGEVGDGYIEEVNQIFQGRDYGYPACEGPCSPPRPEVAEAVYTYQHAAGDSAAVIGGVFYTGENYPPEYRNQYYFADFVRGWVRRLTYEPGLGWVAVEPDFALGDRFAIIGLNTGPEGDLYVILRPSDAVRSGEIRRIEFVGMG
jgi:glucose/arabinose dehydrogenase